VPVSFGEAFAPLFLQFFYLNLVVYWVIVAASHAYQYYQRYQDRALSCGLRIVDEGCATPAISVEDAGSFAIAPDAKHSV